MPYTLLKTNGIQLTIVQDGTIDTTTDLIFVGKNYTGYGNPVNENFVKLLENFSSSTAPAKPLAGQLWYDSANKKIKLYDGSKFKSIGIIDYGLLKPINMNPGDLHFNQTSQILYAYNGLDWIPIGPSSSVSGGGGGGSGLPSITVYDRNVNPHSVLEAAVGTSTQFIVSADSFFEVQQTDSSYANFNSIYTGITLANTNGNGISATSNGSSISGNILWGTAATTLGLIDSTGQNVIPGSDIMRKSELSTGTSIQLVTLNDNGITIGALRALKVHVTNNNVGNISVINGSTLQFNVNVNGGITNVLNVDGSNGLTVSPAGTLNVSLGTPANYFSTIYVNTVTTNLVDSNSLIANTVYTPALSATNIISNSINTPIIIANRVQANGAYITGIVTASQVSSNQILGNQIYDSGYRVLTSATIGNYLTGVGTIQGTANQIIASSPNGAVTLSLASTVAVNSLTASVISGGQVFSNGLPCLTAATIPGGGVTSIQGTNNQILVNGSASSPFTGSVVLSLPGSVAVTTLAANNVLVNSSPAISQGNIGSYAVTSFSAGSTGFTPSTSAGAITLGGTLNVSNGGTGATSLTGYVYGNGIGAMSASTTISGSAISGNISGLAGGLTGTLGVNQGGTGATSLTGYLKGNGTGAFTAVSSIPGSAVSGNISGLSGGAPWGGLTGSPPTVSVFANDAGYITASAIPTNISSFNNNVGYITGSALTGYATQSFVTGQGYVSSAFVHGQSLTVGSTGGTGTYGYRWTSDGYFEIWGEIDGISLGQTTYTIPLPIAFDTTPFGVFLQDIQPSGAGASANWINSYQLTSNQITIWVQRGAGAGAGVAGLYFRVWGLKSAHP